MDLSVRYFQQEVKAAAAAAAPLHVHVPVSKIYQRDIYISLFKLFGHSLTGYSQLNLTSLSDTSIPNNFGHTPGPPRLKI